MNIRYRFKVFLIFAAVCYSDQQLADLQVCKQKLTQEQKLHQQDKSRLKQLLKNTRHNNHVYQRMVQVMIKITFALSHFQVDHLTVKF